MNFTDLFIRRPVLSIVVSMLILLIGGRALLDLPLREFPELTNTVITVSTGYPGAPAELMQGFITTPIEQAIASVDGVDFITSSSQQSSSVVTATMKLNRDPGEAMTEVMSKVQEVRSQLPREANDPIIVKSVGQSVQSMYLSFYSAEMSGEAISDYIARLVRPLLSTVEGVTSVDFMGGQVFAMRLWLDPERMSARGVTADEVAGAIRANNFQSAPGQAKGYFTVTNVTADTALSDVEEFRNLVVKSEDGALVRLRDIANVELGPKDFEQRRDAEWRKRGDRRRVADTVRQSARRLGRHSQAGARHRAYFAAVSQIRFSLRRRGVHQGRNQRGGDHLD